MSSAASARGLFGRMAGPNARRIGLIILCVAAFIMGGGSRGDIASLVVLRPLAFLLLAYAITVGGLADLQRHAAVILFGAAIVFVTAAHLAPLPPDLWQSLGGRDIVVEADILVDAGPIWRPLALNATEAANALASLVVPAAGIALIAVQRSDWRRTALYTMLAMGGLSILLALLQVLGPPNGPFYTYRITNGSSPVGLFANRNHNAIFLGCLLPGLAVLAVDGRPPHRGQKDWRFVRQVACWLGGVLALIFVLTSGSRAGLILAGLAASLIPFVLGTPVRTLLLPPIASASSELHRQGSTGARSTRYLRIVGVFVLALALALVALFGRFGSGVHRLGEGGDNRTEMWEATYPLIGKYFPWGSGAGSFADVFMLDEPYGLLGPKYVNHAHNDVLEVALTFGLPGLLLMAVFALFLLKRGVSLWRARTDASFDARMRRLGFVLLVLLPVASVVDYPLRTPALSVLFVIGVAWLTAGSRWERLGGPRLTRTR